MGMNDSKKQWFAALQAGAEANRARTNENLAGGRVWTDERRAAWTAKAKTSWTPEKREAARQRALARHAARKVMGESKHEDANAAG